MNFPSQSEHTHLREKAQQANNETRVSWSYSRCTLTNTQSAI